jgi:O-methyltransferase
MHKVYELINKILSYVGIEMRWKKGPRVLFSNFADLAHAYEERLHQLGILFPPNKMRSILLARLIGTPPSEAYFIVEAVERCKNIRGDVCEFGVAQGETSALIANEITGGNKTIHLFDSFQGLPTPTEKDQLKDDIFSLGTMGAYAGKMACAEKMVRARLEAISFPLNRVRIHRGFIDQVLRNDSTLPTHVNFAYVDFDFYDPIRQALDFLHRTTSAGSIIIVDDYNFFSTGVKHAVDEFLSEKNLKELTYEKRVPELQNATFIILTRTKN